MAGGVSHWDINEEAYESSGGPKINNNTYMLYAISLNKKKVFFKKIYGRGGNNIEAMKRSIFSPLTAILKSTCFILN